MSCAEMIAELVHTPCLDISPFRRNARASLQSIRRILVYDYSRSHPDTKQQHSISKKGYRFKYIRPHTDTSGVRALCETQRAVSAPVE